MKIGAIPLPRTEPDMDAWALVTAAQGGDRDAFGQLYARYEGVVFRFVLYRVGDRALAEDLTSETFLRALRRIDAVSYRGRDVGAWFVTIARNLVLDHVKCSRTKLERTFATVTDTGSEPGPDGPLIDADTARVLWECVGRLTAEQRQCVTLRFLHGLSVAETAAAVGCAEAAVKARQHRGVRALAEMPELATLRG